MGTILFESSALVKKLDALLHQVGLFLGFDPAIRQRKKGDLFFEIVRSVEGEKAARMVKNCCLLGENQVLRIRSENYYELLSTARDVFQRELLLVLAQEKKMPRSSYIVLSRTLNRLRLIHHGSDNLRALSQYHLEVHFEEDQYPWECRYFMRQGTGTLFLLQEWLQQFSLSLQEAFVHTGELTDKGKEVLLGQQVFALKYFQRYQQHDGKERPVFWRYNRFSTSREHLIALFHRDVAKGYVGHYHPEKWRRKSYPKIRALMASPSGPQKLFFRWKRKTLVLDASSPGDEIYVLTRSRKGNSSKILGILSNSGLVLQSMPFYPQIGALLQRIEDNPKEAIVQEGRVSGHCAMCFRRLEQPSSIQAGVGPICARKLEVLSRGEKGPVQQSLF